jgi:hypothetical protein
MHHRRTISTGLPNARGGRRTHATSRHTSIKCPPPELGARDPCRNPKYISASGHAGGIQAAQMNPAGRRPWDRSQPKGQAGRFPTHERPAGRSLPNWRLACSLSERPPAETTRPVRRGRSTPACPALQWHAITHAGKRTRGRSAFPPSARRALGLLTCPLRRWRAVLDAGVTVGYTRVTAILFDSCVRDQ